MVDAWTITVDCRPGAVRPADLLGPILRQNGLSLESDFAEPQHFFGQWTFTLVSSAPPFPPPEVRQRVGDALTALYHAGALRYADW